MKNLPLVVVSTVGGIGIGLIFFLATPFFTRDDGYLSPPLDAEQKSQITVAVENQLAEATYASIGKPFGCDTDCRDEEFGFAEARADGVTQSEECANRFSDQSMMSNATQDGCRAYTQARNSLIDSQRSQQNGIDKKNY